MNEVHIELKNNSFPELLCLLIDKNLSFPKNKIFCKLIINYHFHEENKIYLLSPLPSIFQSNVTYKSKNFIEDSLLDISRQRFLEIKNDYDLLIPAQNLSFVPEDKNKNFSSPNFKKMHVNADVILAKLNDFQILQSVDENKLANFNEEINFVYYDKNSSIPHIFQLNDSECKFENNNNLFFINHENCPIIMAGINVFKNLNISFIKNKNARLLTISKKNELTLLDKTYLSENKLLLESTLHIRNFDNKKTYLFPLNFEYAINKKILQENKLCYFHFFVPRSSIFTQIVEKLDEKENNLKISDTINNKLISSFPENLFLKKAVNNVFAKILHEEKKQEFALISGEISLNFDLHFNGYQKKLFIINNSELEKINFHLIEEDKYNHKNNLFNEPQENIQKENFELKDDENFYRKLEKNKPKIKPLIIESLLKHLYFNSFLNEKLILLENENFKIKLANLLETYLESNDIVSPFLNEGLLNKLDSIEKVTFLKEVSINLNELVYIWSLNLVKNLLTNNLIKNYQHLFNKNNKIAIQKADDEVYELEINNFFNFLLNQLDNSFKISVETINKCDYLEHHIENI